MDDRYEILRFNKWNRRLLNLYWIYNVIVLITELIHFYYFIVYLDGDSWFSAEYQLIQLILIPTILMISVTLVCEAAVAILKNRYRGIIPYVMTFTCVAYCCIIQYIQSAMVVLCVSYVIPIAIALLYDDKKVLRITSLCAFFAFFGVYIAIINFGDPRYLRLDVAELTTGAALLATIHLLYVVILKRNREIINTLVEAEHSASRAEAVADARTRFLANMSHEIRTPMNGIIGLTELALGDKTLSGKQKDYLHKINRSAGGLLTIVNDILDITKIDAGEVTVEKTPFYLHEIISECRTSVANSADKKKLKLIFQDKTVLAKKIIGDPTKLRQTLLNLLSNAVKFTEKGSVTLTVRGEKSHGNTMTIHFEIADTGIGITNEQQATIFEPFKQADDSTTRKYGGTGLGLSITKGIIEMMGGKIQVESAPGVGSVFSFELIFELFDSEQNELQITTAYRPVFTGSVLVCEDNELNRQVAVESLEKLGFNITVAENGKLGIDEVKKRKQKAFDVILMDIHMPVMDGFSAAKELIKLETKTPIIAMTADAMPADREKCLASGMTDYISKPFTLRDLWVCLLKYLTPVGEVLNDEDREFTENKELTGNSTEFAIDMLLGIKNSAGSEELHKKMLISFEQTKRGTYEQLENAVKNKDYSLARQIAHGEKGEALIIGAVRLAEILASLDEIFKSDAPSNYDSLMKDYRAELENVLQYIKNMNT